MNRPNRATSRVPSRLRPLNLPTKRKKYFPIRVRVERSGLSRPIRSLRSNVGRRARYLIHSLYRSFPRRDRLRLTRIYGEVPICSAIRDHLVRPSSVAIAAFCFHGRLF